MKKILEKLIGYGNYNAIKEAFKQLVYNSIDAEAFESGWAEFINTHALEKNDWLSSLFEER